LELKGIAFLLNYTLMRAAAPFAASLAIAEMEAGDNAQIFKIIEEGR
jgi:hypothetical protein